MYSKLREVMIDNPNKTIYVERSLLSVCIFARLNYQEGFMTEKEYGVFEQYYNLLASNIDQSTTCKMIYIEVSPETCQIQIGARDRSGEDGISLEYLQKLNAEFDIMCLENADVIIAESDKEHTGRINLLPRNATVDEIVELL